MSGSHALVTSKFNTPMNKVQEDFQRRNHVAPSYRGPVYAVEDIYVPCALCRTPVDPVTRIPVGRLYFHPRCLRCAVCERPATNQAFAEVKGQPVCGDCHHRGFKPPKPLAASAFASHDAWDQRAASAAMNASRTPASAFTDAQLRLQHRQQAILAGDNNIRLLSDRHGDDPSQRAAYINNPDGVASRQRLRLQSRGGASAKEATPARQLLPSLAAAAGSASLRGHRNGSAKPSPK
uniref:LIM zinc-binding domain-containing protein n=1 Tax=Neobodo designis TaxID=312471 RepID=A0A7S1MSY5_NEODS|mmetsp:Transcript_45217/g.139487  ORF Transcript_45217/g.139487 Transcript_45217/m.139487 type:complete len:236 (+) Transcript_45217:117-824(+)